MHAHKYTDMHAQRLQHCNDMTANLKSYRLYTSVTFQILLCANNLHKIASI